MIKVIIKIMLKDNKPTQTQLQRKQYNEDHFDIEQHNDFINDKNRKGFKHICNKCINKYNCNKCKTSIVLKCVDFKNKGGKR